MSTWVQEVQGDDVDLESIAANHNTLKINDVNNNDADRPAIYAANSNGGANARALKIEGKSEFLGKVVAELDDASTTVQIINDSEEVNARALVVDGRTDLNGDVQINGNIVDDVNVRDGSVNVISDGIGEGFVHLGEVMVGGQDRGPRLHFLGAIPGNGGARIDAFMNDGGESVPDDWPLMELHLNTDEGVRDVVISHRDDVDPNFPRATVHVECPRLVVGARETAALDPQIGHIDGSGTATAPVDLRVGTRAITANLELSREGQTIDMFGQARLNGNGVILNDADSLTDAAGLGFIANVGGHGGGGPAMDFYANGALVGWWDAAGIHVNP